MPLDPNIDSSENLQGLYDDVASQPDDGQTLDASKLPTDAPDSLKQIASNQNETPPVIDYQLNTIPYAMGRNSEGLTSDPDFKGINEKAGVIKSAEAEFENLSTPYHAIHGLYENINQNDPLDDPRPPNWNSKTDNEKFLNIRPENMQYLFEATGPKDQDRRLQRIYHDQDVQDTLDNGSFIGKVLGGAVGLIADPTNLIPIAGWAKYGKLGNAFVKNFMRTVPGATAYGAISAGAEQIDKINGNLKDFFTDTFTRAAFTAGIFGLGGVVSSLAERSALWESRNISKNYMEGVDYKLNMDEEGKITGITAHDTTGDLSAAKVNLAQDLANSTFAKSGLFKIPSAILSAPGIKPLADKIAELPYARQVGGAISNAAFHFYKYFGSEIPLMLNSPYAAVRAFVNRGFDHGIRTEGMAAGEAAPKSFEFLMKKTYANLSAISAQLNALHLQRNGFDIKNRLGAAATDVGLNVYNKGLKFLAKDLDSKGYTNRDTFDDEVQNVLRNNANSQHAPVNDAAKLIRKHLDDTYTAYRTAYNLPKDWMPPRTAEGYLMRVYNTPYMNTNLNSWTKVISNWLQEADGVINARMQPINDLSANIKRFEEQHTQAVEILANHEAQRIGNEYNKSQVSRGTTIENSEQETGLANTNEIQTGTPEYTLRGMRIKLRAMKDQLQNELRSNPDLNLHVDDHNALSANEAKELEGLLAPQRKIEKDIAQQKEVVRQKKASVSSKLSRAKNEGSLEKAVPKSKGYVNQRNDELRPEIEKLNNLQRDLETEKDKLQESAHKGEINPRFYIQSKDGFNYEFKDPNNRLKFRDVYPEGSMENPNIYRENAARAYYQTIMNQMPEETINQIMGRFTGNSTENHIKQRTLLVPDDILYDNGFMSKDLMAKVGNYTNYLARRTHLKTAYNEISHGDGIERILAEANSNFQEIHNSLNDRKAALQEKLNAPELSNQDKKALQANINDIEREINSRTNRYNSDVKSMEHLYGKMIGRREWSQGAEQAKSIIMSLASAATLPFVPFTQITDLSAVALQHGTWAMVRDGMYPLVQSLFGMLKTKDSESFRNTAPSIHLALQDVRRGYENKNYGFQTNPYINMGRWVDTANAIAHTASNLTLTNYIDNYLQRITAAVTQSELMRIMYAFKNGNMSAKDGLYIRKYGIDPSKWSDRMIKAFEQDGGGKTKLGGYQSLHYQWKDIDAANEFGDAVFRGVKDTQLQKGMADSPFWTDTPLGAIISGFSGWGYASVNRYVIPTMQQPDAQKFLGILCMLGAGALVDPMRRMARGDSPYPDNVTDKQMMWSAFNNAPIFSFAANTLSNANLLTGNALLGNLRSDKYVDRTRAGLLGPAWGQGNRILDVISAAASGEWNKADMNKAARMLPYINSSWLAGLDKKLIDSTSFPENRRQAHALKESNQ